MTESSSPKKNPDRTHVMVLAGCAAVGVLAANGVFNSISNFPPIFALVCLVFGALALWRDRARGRIGPRAVMMLAGIALAIGGWAWNGHVVRQSLRDLQARVFERLGGTRAPELTGLEPLDTEPHLLEAASSFGSSATIVTFWATWCSPCWVEFEELEDLYRKHRDRGLTVLAITRYDSIDPDARRKVRDGSLAFLRRRGHSFPAAITANDSIYRAFQVRSIPSTALVDASGTIVAYGVGLDGVRELMAKAEALVGARGEGS